MLTKVFTKYYNITLLNIVYMLLTLVKTVIYINSLCIYEMLPKGFIFFNCTLRVTLIDG